MTLWMTDDARHIPIKLKAKIKFGHIYAHLTSYRTTPIKPVNTAPQPTVTAIRQPGQTAQMEHKP